MTIAEIVNECGKVTRIDFWDDNQVRVIQSHTVSIKYLLLSDYNFKKPIYKKGHRPLNCGWNYD